MSSKFKTDNDICPRYTKKSSSYMCIYELKCMCNIYIYSNSLKYLITATFSLLTNAFILYCEFFIFYKFLACSLYVFTYIMYLFSETGSYMNNEGSGLYALQSACKL